MKFAKYAVLALLVLSMSTGLMACDDDTPAEPTTTTAATTDPASPTESDPGETDDETDDPADDTDDPATPADTSDPGETDDPTDPSTPGDGDTTPDTPDCGDDHQYTSVVTEPTCAAKGYTTYTCSVCGHSYKEESDAEQPLHEYGAEFVYATCTTDGYTVYTCSGCGDTYEDDFEAASHQYQDRVVPPTCRADGYTAHTCSVCGDSYQDTPTEQLQHVFETPVSRTYPTVTNPTGVTTYRCNTCTETKGEELAYDTVYTGCFATSTTPVARGLDLSYWQNEQTDTIHINFQAIKDAGLDFVILRAGYDTTKDIAFEMNYADAKAAGLDVGVYFYTMSTDVAGVEADVTRVLEWIKGKKFEYPIYFDLEDKSQQTLEKATLSAMISRFMELMQAEGYYTALYTGNSFLQYYLDTETILETYDIWYARYPVMYPDGYVWSGDATVPEWPASLTGYDLPFSMWQFTDSSTVEGVTYSDNITQQKMDANICYKDYPTIMKTYGLNGYGEDLPTPDEAENAKTYVWITLSTNSLNVRSSPDFSSATNKIGIARGGERYEVLEKATSYTKILFDDDGTLVEAYISANPLYVTFTDPNVATTV